MYSLKKKLLLLLILCISGLLLNGCRKTLNTSDVIEEFEKNYYQVDFINLNNGYNYVFDGLMNGLDESVTQMIKFNYKKSYYASLIEFESVDDATKFSEIYLDIIYDWAYSHDIYGTANSVLLKYKLITEPILWPEEYTENSYNRSYGNDLSMLLYPLWRVHSISDLLPDSYDEFIKNYIKYIPGYYQDNNIVIIGDYEAIKCISNSYKTINIENFLELI